MTTPIYKAEPIGDLRVPDLQLSATLTIPKDVGGSHATLGQFEAALRAFYDAQGKEVVRQLVASLPNATIDAILVELLDRRRSLFRVPLVESRIPIECTGTLVHDEFTTCPVHDRRVGAG